jgi:two-component system nitrate/nitrite response regulator NarL
MHTPLTRKTVLVVESQPLTSEGVRSVLSGCDDLEFTRAVDTLAAAAEFVRPLTPDLVLIDKTFGSQAVVEWLTSVRSLQRGGMASQVVVWGSSITEPEALRLLQIGVKGILRKTSDPETLLVCLRAVAAGANWMEDSLFRDSSRGERYARSELTPREQQVLEQVEQGLKNKEIARELGIRPGTVKIHLKHIFEKTGVRGRYGLALTGLKEKGVFELSPA